MTSRWILAFLLLALPVTVWGNDWENELRSELKAQGFSKAEIEEAVSEERRVRSGGQVVPDFKLPPNRVVREGGQTDEAEDILRTRLLALGYTGSNLDRQVAKYSRMAPEARETKLQALEADRNAELWVAEQLEPVIEVLEDSGWKGGELKERIRAEEGYLKSVKHFYDEAEEETGGEREPGVDEKAVDKERDEFEEDLAKDYVKDAERKLREKWNDKLKEAMIKRREEFIDLAWDDRKNAMTAIAREIKLKQIEEREKILGNVGKIIQQQLQLVWAETALPPRERKERKKAIEILCGDLAMAEDEATFRKILEVALREMRKQEYDKDELEVIETELVEMVPQD